MDGTKIKKCCTLSNGIAPDAVAIVGVANAGLVGTIAASHIIEKMKMEEVAHINSSIFPPVSVFIDGVLKNPFRIYSDIKDARGTMKQASTFVVTSELPLNKETFHEIAHVLVDYIQELGIKKVVTLVGFPVEEMEKMDVFFAAEPELMERLKKVPGIQPLPKGMIFGLEALVLNETLEREIEGFTLIAPVKEYLPATRSAAALIESLNTIFPNLAIDVKELLERDDVLQAKLKELAEQVRRSNNEEYTPPPPSKNMSSLFT
ncbi:MAG: proteasome assembly chaperone family protein [Candidatus Lokiarchaeota archaeon]|nr:proteasome assembly chaperone family protein [Candidatus Lokiarchaeota archaeon]